MLVVKQVTAALDWPVSFLGEAQLLSLAVQRLDRGELVYTSTANGFLADSPVLPRVLCWNGRAATRDVGPTVLETHPTCWSDGCLGPISTCDCGAAAAEEENDSNTKIEDMTYSVMMGHYCREKRNDVDAPNATAW